MTSENETLWFFLLLSKCTSLAFCSLLFLIFLVKSIFHHNHVSVIPGPRGLPVIGSMLLMTGLAHRKIAAAAESYGAKRLMSLRVGETRVIVTCHPDVAKEILNGSAFVDRPVKESARILMFERAIGFAPYGAYWRTLRRIAAIHLFSPKQMKASEMQRKLISDEMVEMMMNKGEPSIICVRDLIKRASLCNMMWCVFGRKCKLDSEELVELRKLVDEGYQVLGTFNWSDHLPWLTDFDPQRIRFRCSNLVPKVKRLVNRMIQEHQAPHTIHHQHHPNLDFTHVLLSLPPSERLSDSDMIAVLWEMIFRGTDTVAVMMEWILARLVLHPDVQSSVRDELDRVVGRCRRVNESDIANLVHLLAVVKEVLRLHPPGPLLSWARLATSDTTVDGHHVAAGTTAMVNMWAISRDQHLWKDPLEFRPQRFGKDDLSVMGSDLRVAPFGSGRRSCPGKTLGLTTVSFWVASLLQEFELMNGHNNKVDLTEVLKLSCEMANPLILNVRPRRPYTVSTTSFLSTPNKQTML